MLHSLMASDTYAGPDEDQLHVAAVLIDEAAPARLRFLLWKSVWSVATKELCRSWGVQADGGIDVESSCDILGAPRVPPGSAGGSYSGCRRRRGHESARMANTVRVRNSAAAAPRR